MKNILTLMILILTPFLSQAQGLLGKTFLIAPHFSVGPDLGDLSRGGDLMVQSSVELDLEKVLNRGNSIGIFGSYSGMKIDPWINNGYRAGSLRGKGMGIFYKKYLIGKGAIAPLGSWFKFTYVLHRYNAESLDPFYFYSDKGIPSWSARLAWGGHWRFSGSILLMMAVEMKMERFTEKSGVSQEVYSNAAYHAAGSYANVKLGLVFPLF